jgi:hypothetical protein
MGYDLNPPTQTVLRVEPADSGRAAAGSRQLGSRAYSAGWRFGNLDDHLPFGIPLFSSIVSALDRYTFYRR